MHSRSIRSRSWLTSTTAPGNSARLSSSTSSAGMSRSLVGSSSSSRSAGWSISWAMRTRACSPPDRSPTGTSSCSGRKRNCFAQADDVQRPVAVHHRVAVRAQRPPQRRRRVERRPALLEHHRPQAVGPRDRAGVGRELAGEHAQQRALAAAVGAEQAELACRATGSGRGRRTAAGRRATSRCPSAVSSFRVCRPVATKSMPAAPAAALRYFSSASSARRPAASSMRDARLAPLGRLLAAQPLRLAADLVGDRLLLPGLGFEELLALVGERRRSRRRRGSTRRGRRG